MSKMNTSNSFASRMKDYEIASEGQLVKRMPVIIRVDGKNFSKLTKRFCEKPFDKKFILCMEAAALKLCKSAQNVRMAYMQSDEISILMTDYRTIMTDAWFDNRTQKIASVSAGITTAGFLQEFVKQFPNAIEAGAWPSFDARVFNIPREDVTNYFIWRQRDAERNSVSMLAQANFSHKELQGCDRAQMIDMLVSRKGVNWNDIDVVFKRGAAIMKHKVIIEGDGFASLRSRWTTDWNTPLFLKNREFVEKNIRPED